MAIARWLSIIPALVILFTTASGCSFKTTEMWQSVNVSWENLDAPGQLITTPAGGRSLLFHYSFEHEQTAILVPLNPDGSPVSPFNIPTADWSNLRETVTYSQLQNTAIAADPLQRDDLVGLFVAVKNPAEPTTAPAGQANEIIGDNRIAVYRFRPDGTIEWVRLPMQGMRCKGEPIPAKSDGTWLVMVPNSHPRKPSAMLPSQLGALAMTPVMLTYDTAATVVTIVTFPIWFPIEFKKHGFILI